MPVSPEFRSVCLCADEFGARDGTATVLDRQAERPVPPGECDRFKGEGSREIGHVVPAMRSYAPKSPEISEHLGELR